MALEWPRCVKLWQTADSQRPELRTNITEAAMRLPVRAISTATSPMLAREQGHRGWTAITRFSLSRLRGILLCAGQVGGAFAGVPGLIEYCHNITMPTATAPS